MERLSSDVGWLVTPYWREISPFEAQLKQSSVCMLSFYISQLWGSVFVHQSQGRFRVINVNSMSLSPLGKFLFFFGNSRKCIFNFFYPFSFENCCLKSSTQHFLQTLQILVKEDEPVHKQVTQLVEENAQMKQLALAFTI